MKRLLAVLFLAFLGATCARAEVTGLITEPGGTDTQVQYNNNLAFGGDSGFVYNENTNQVTVDSGTIKWLALSSATVIRIIWPDGTTQTSALAQLIVHDEGTYRGVVSTLDVVGLGGTLTVSGGTATLTIPGTFAAYDEGSFQGNASSVNVTGVGATASITGGTWTISVPGLAAYDEGTFQGNISSINAVGAGVSASVAGSTLTLTVPGSVSLPLPNGSTTYIQHSTAATGGVFNVSSGTVAGSLTLGSALVFSNSSSITAVATQAQMEAAVSSNVAVTPNFMQHDPGNVKVWVNFVGTGTVTILGSNGVSSITDSAVGKWIVNFSKAFSNTNFSGVADGITNDTVVAVHCGGTDFTATTTSAWPIQCVRIDTSANYDSPKVFFHLLGDY